MSGDNPASKAARVLSRLGASKGGKARAASMTPEQRSAIAREAALARWAKARAGGESTGDAGDLPARLRAANADLARFTSVEQEAAIEAAAVEIERLRAANAALLAACEKALAGLRRRKGTDEAQKLAPAEIWAIKGAIELATGEKP